MALGAGCEIDSGLGRNFKPGLDCDFRRGLGCEFGSVFGRLWLWRTASCDFGPVWLALGVPLALSLTVTSVTGPALVVTPVSADFGFGLVWLCCTEELQ